MQCNSIPRTSVDLVSTGHCKGNAVPEDIPTVYEGMLGLCLVLNISNFELTGCDWSGFWVTNRNPVRNMMMFLYGHNIVEQNLDTGIVYAMNFSFAAAHLRDLNKNLKTRMIADMRQARLDPQAILVWIVHYFAKDM